MQLRSLANKDLRALLSVLDGAPVAAVRQGLIESLPPLLAPYLTASGELAAVMMEDLRAEAGRRGTFYAEVPDVMPAAARVEATSRWAVAPLADESLQATVGSRLSGSVSRMIMDASRDTMYANGRETRMFQRMPRPGCCAFCGLLASRPSYMAYTSYASASAVTGRGSTRTGFASDGTRLAGGVGGGVKSRGSREIGAATHDDCHCVVVPVYFGTEMAALASATQEKYEDLYAEVASENAAGARALKPSLSEWRKAYGTK